MRRRRWLGAALMAAVVVVGACDETTDETPRATVTPSATSTAAPRATSAGSGTAAAPVTRTGVLVRDNPGMPPGRWFLLYEEPGRPALTLELGITSATRCLEDTKVARCDALVPGTRVRVEGALARDRLEVTTLEVLEAPSAP